MIIFLRIFYKSLFSIFLIYLYCSNNSVYSNFIRDTEIENIINSWSHPIFKAAGIPVNTINIHLVADNEINAFVTDGKNMFLNTGLIIKAGSASGLIGVIAHETGHIAAGHIVKLKQTMRKLEDNQFITSLLGMGILVLGSTNDNFKNDRVDIANTVLSIGPSLAQKSFFAFSRGNEYVADSLAIKYLKKTNRSPASLSIILEKLYGQELLLPERQDPFLRTHPLTRERMEMIKSKTPKKPIIDSKADKQSYLRIKAKLEGFLDNPGKVLLNNKGNTVPERYARSIAYFRAPMFRKSIDEVNRLINEFPNDPYFLELKGQIYSENGYIEDAIRAYNKCLKIIPQSPLILLALSGLYLESSNTSKKRLLLVKEYLFDIIKEEPDNILAWHLKGITHSRLGEKTEADLSAAEEYLRRRNYKSAIFFAKKVINNTKRFSSQSIRASDIIKIVDQI